MRSKCACGQVEIKLLTSEHESINCHCNMCRSRSGAVYTTWVTINKDFVEVPELGSSLSEYKVSDDSKVFFCRSCGTHVLFQDDKYKNVLAFMAGTIEGFSITPPKAEYFYSDKAEWFKPDLETQKYGGDSGFEEI